MRMMKLGGLLCLLVPSCDLIAGDLDPPPETLVVPCQEPRELPHREMTQAEVEVAWGGDRSALRTCGERHGLLLEWARGQVEVGR